MKKIIIISMELDSHAGSSVFVVQDKKAYDSVIRSFTQIEGAPYELIHEREIDEDTKEMFYDGELGKMSILVKTFSAYKDIINKELFTRTG